MPQINVDDPHCVYTTFPNGTIKTSYTGLLSAWDTVEAACSGLNLRAANTTLSIIGLLISSTCIILAYKFLLSRRRTAYNILMQIIPITTFCGHVFDLISTLTYYQYFDHPNLTHMPKLFFYAGGLMIGAVEGIRVEFVLIVMEKSRLFVKRFMVGLMTIGVLLCIASVMLFVLGMKYGPEAVPFRYTWPYSIWFIIVGLTDIILSAILLHLCYRQTAIIKSYDMMTVEEVRSFAQRFKIASALQLAVIVAFATMFNFATASMGYTFAWMTTLALPLQDAMMVYSVYTLQRMQESKNLRMGSGCSKWGIKESRTASSEC